MAPRRRCTVCGSHQWHREPATGLVVCSEGHVLRNYLNETHEMHEVGPHQLQKRALKSARERRGRASKANPQLYYGARAQYLYFQCLQLLLRKQVAALVRIWKLPSEFEIICRDLWALHLSLLPSPPPPEPLLHKQSTRGHPRDGGSKLVGSKKRRSKSSLTAADDKEAVEMEEISPGQSNANTFESDDSEEDSEMDELLLLFSESSLSEDDRDDDDNMQLRPKPEGSGQRSDMFVRNGPARNVALLMVAFWTLRLPIIYMDLIRFDDGKEWTVGSRLTNAFRLIECYDLPYLEPLHHLPESMVRHLTKHSVRALSPLVRSSNLLRT